VNVEEWEITRKDVVFWQGEHIYDWYRRAVPN
jgi:hypothetical protein